MDIDVGHLNTCANTAEGFFCWGANYAGQLGFPPTGEMCGTTPCATTPSPVRIGGVDRFDVGLGFVCAIQFEMAAPLSCWGWNSYGQVGGGTTTESEPATRIPGDWDVVSAGALHACALASGGDPWCWGAPFVQQALGRGLEAQNSTPARVAGGLSFSAIDAGDGNWWSSHTCGVGRFDRLVYCWGSNADGALGVEVAPEQCSIVLGQTPLDFDCSGEPVRVTTATTFSDVSAGAGYTCADADDGRVFCWGYNGEGQLGDGTTANRRTPAPIVTE